MMDCGLIFKKTSTCTKNPDIEYLDETSDYKLRIKSKQTGIPLEELKCQNENIQKSVAYLTKEEHGQVFAGGFLRDALLSKNGLAPEKWDNEFRKKVITSAIFKSVREHGAFRGTMGHKLVFSVSSELQEKVEKSGLNLDYILSKEVKKIMYEFQQKFYPGQKIGYAWGIHHDTNHRHIHLFLCNRTDKGKNVAMSCGLKNKSKKHVQVDYLGFMIDCTKAAKDRILKRVQKLNNQQSLRQNKEVFLEPVKHDFDQNKKLIVQRAEVLRSYQELNAKENELKITKEKIRRLYDEYHLSQALLRQGFSEVKNLNRKIRESYAEIKKGKPSYILKVLRKVTGPFKSIYKVLTHLERISENKRRTKILASINFSKILKRKILQQLESLDKEKKEFLLESRKLKQKRKVIQKEFFSKLWAYQRAEEKYNYDFFMSYSPDKNSREEYKKLSKELWQKRKKKDPESLIELEKIQALDKAVRVKELNSESDNVRNKRIRF